MELARFGKLLARVNCQVRSASQSLLRCIFFNARSLCNKIGSLRGLLATLEFDVVLVVETWLTSAILDSHLLAFHPYNVIRCDRNVRRGGGVAVFYKSELKIVHVAVDPIYSAVELCALDIVGNGAHFRLICSYLAPDVVPLSISNTIHCINSLSCVTLPVCLIGDFNLPAIDWSSLSFPQQPHYISFMFDMVFFNGFSQFVTVPTRGKSILDLLFTNDSGLLSSFEVILPFTDSCDHHCIRFSLNYFDASSGGSIDRRYRDFKRTDWDSARLFLTSINWIVCFANCVSVDQYWDGFLGVINALICNFVPLSTATTHLRYPRHIRRLLARKRRAWVPAFRASPSQRARYNRLCIQCSRAIKRFDILHEEKVISSRNIGTFYNFVKRKRSSYRSVCPLKRFDGSTAVTDVDKATVLNNHFSSTFTVDDGLDHVFALRCNGKLSTVEFPPYVVRDKLSKLKRSFSCGPDGVPKILLKMLASEICVPLARIFEYSFGHAVLPAMWRCADVVPLFKKGCTSEPGNYRPISLTCTCCRVMESIVKDSLGKFLLSHKLISPYQHGFTAGRSPCTQLLECLDDWSKCVRDNMGVYVVYIDFAKAFDTVNHRKLLIKLRGYGICGGVISWIRSFLTDRFQRVKIDHTYSTWLPVTSGVPQGSVLGPLLFLLYVNDLPDLLPSAVTPKLFADDLKIYAPVGNSTSLQHALHLLLEWCFRWQLHVQPLKCHVLPVGCAINDDTAFTLGTVVLHKVDSCRDLGVIMSSSLNFVEHYSSIVEKAGRALAVLFRCFRTSNKRMLLLAFNVYVRPILEYCSPVWNPCLIGNIKTLESVQRNFTRRLFSRCNLDYQEYESRLNTLNISSLAHRRRIADLLLCYQIKTLRIKVGDILSWSSHHPYRLFVDHPRVNFRRHFFSHRIMQDWNRLGNDISDCESLNSFRRLLFDKL
ncbi:MAG: hypothetical protein GY821_16275 [Gammaproteobacteria bacterium]|nr:hypothetical protein [Gammaproteobacteria bacterium]